MLDNGFIRLSKTLSNRVFVMYQTTKARSLWFLGAVSRWECRLHRGGNLNFGLNSVMGLKPLQHILITLAVQKCYWPAALSDNTSTDEVKEIYWSIAVLSGEETSTLIETVKELLTHKRVQGCPDVKGCIS